MMTLAAPRSALLYGTIATFALTVGCGESSQPQPAPQMPGGPAMPGPIEGPPAPSPMPPPPPPAPKYAGVYALSAPIDLTQNGVLPGLLGPALDALTKLHDHPGQAILEIVANANIPTVSGAVNGLPGFVKDLLASLLDKLVTDQLYQNVPVADQITSMISGLTEITKTIEIRDSLTLHAPAMNGNANVEQQLTDVGFTLLGAKELVTLDPSEQAAARASMTGSVTPHANKPVADADLAFDGGKVSLPFGSLVLRAAGPLLFSQFGGAMDLKTALANVVQCSAAAQSISDGIGGALPPGIIDAVCSAAMSAIADQVTAQIENITLGDVQISKATAQLYDTMPASYQASYVRKGSWQWGFSVAGSVIEVPSTFSGDRVADAQ